MQPPLCIRCATPPNSPKPLVFNPTDKCPAFVVNPKIARQALEKQRADELEYAQLLEDNVPTAPIYSQMDGGMNKVFLSRFPDRVTLSKKLSRLDLAQHPVRVFWKTDVALPDGMAMDTDGTPLRRQSRHPD